MNRLVLIVLSAVTLMGSVGCDVAVPGLPSGKMPSEPIGTDFQSATPVSLDGGAAVVIAGTIEVGSPDVYDLGPCNPGDRIIITVDPATGSLLDPTVAVFDADGELFTLNDDVDLSAGLLGSQIDETVWLASDHYYLAISKFFFDSQGGAYGGSIRIERGGTVSDPLEQRLLLNFAGGNVTILGEGSFDLDPFDAADVDAAYAGQTDAIKAKIEETVRQNFQNTGLIIVTSADQLPSTCTFSTIHFGAYSTNKFGVAESVDQGNRDVCDDGIVFTNDFDKPFATQPTVDGIAVAIGNVAAHEAGHLLGLSHVADVTALMDDTGTASTLLADQELKTAPLSQTVFPIGWQNAPALLDRVIP